MIAETGEFTGSSSPSELGVDRDVLLHFATKDHAIAACLAVCFEEYEQRMAEVESIERLLDAGLRQTLADIVTAISAINDAYRALLRLARARIQASHLLREVSREEEHRAFAAAQRFVRLGQSAGQIRQGDPESLTATMRTVVEGLDAWTIRAHPAVATREIPDLLSRYLSPE